MAKSRGVRFPCQVVTRATGVARIGSDGSGVLGRGGIDRVLQLAPGHEPLLSTGALPAQPGRWHPAETERAQRCTA